MEQDAREEQAIKESKTSKNTTQSNLKRIENEPLAFGKRKFFQRLGLLTMMRFKHKTSASLSVCQKN